MMSSPFAETHYTAADLADVTFYTPDGCAGVGLGACLPNGGPGEQEHGMVPEGGAALMYLLLAGATCFGAMFYTRRQTMTGGWA